MMNKFKMFYKLNPILNIMYKSLINLPTPSNISYLWNFGSLLGLCLLIQIFSGLFLSFHYMANINYTFNNIDHIYRNVNYGWLIKLIHSNTASFFFICIYMHIGKNMYYGSYQLKMVWFSGIIILFLLMMTAFLGYVLPWGQMSFWGATVITNLLSTIPYLGIMLVNWIWGGFSISNAALVRFFSFHFILPFIILAMVLIHLIFLHLTGSNNPLGINSNLDKISFHNFFLLKDMLGYIIMLISLIYLLIMNPFMFHDAENFIAANSLVTPIHIQPEWYFLFAYAILRSIPNKLGGVIALLMSILILGILPFLNKKKIQSNQFYPVNQMLFWIYFNSTVLLTWIGMCPVEIPYILIGQILTILYFLLFFMISFFYKFWDKMLFN